MSAGAVTSSPLGAVAKDRLRYRWFWSNPCVGAPVRTSAIPVMFAVSGVSTKKPPPYATVVGAVVMAGRGPLKRYGGE